MFHFICFHRKLSRVFTEPENRRKYYQLCLSCCQKFEYNWDDGKIGRGKKIPLPEPKMEVARR